MWHRRPVRVASDAVGGTAEPNAAAAAAATDSPNSDPPTTALRTLDEVINKRNNTTRPSPPPAQPSETAGVVVSFSHLSCSSVRVACEVHRSSVGLHSDTNTQLLTYMPYVLPAKRYEITQNIYPIIDMKREWRIRWTEIATNQIPKSVLLYTADHTHPHQPIKTNLLSVFMHHPCVLSSFRHHAYQSVRSSLEHHHRTKLCSTLSKESLRILQRHFRCAKDHTIRGRRLVREVASYWRRAERDAIENRKRAEREELELRRRQTEQKEVERQKKKLEFLLTQTELYSHFIGRKMGIVDASAVGPTAAVKVESNDPNASSTAAAAATPSSTDGTPSLLQRATSVRNEAGDRTADEATRAYIAEQRSKMAEFDKLETGRNGTAVSTATPPPVSSSPSIDGSSNGGVVGDLSLEGVDDSLDLLNPSTMPEQESFVQAANSFQGNLKEYQIRGLNWLLNLYEQGINGILAGTTNIQRHTRTLPLIHASSFNCVSS